MNTVVLMKDLNESVKLYYGKIESPLGDLILGSIGEDSLCWCDWLHNPNHEKRRRRMIDSLCCTAIERDSQVIREAEMQLQEYLHRQRKCFDLPLSLYGTDFQKNVWTFLVSIPYGETLSYAGVAARLGIPSSVRAVANAIGANPLSIFIPCHRVVGSRGVLTGYAGGIDAKRGLLDIECLVGDGAYTRI